MQAFPASGYAYAPVRGIRGLQAQVIASEYVLLLRWPEFGGDDQCGGCGLALPVPEGSRGSGRYACSSFLRNPKPAERQPVEFDDAVAIAARADRESRRPSRGLLVAHGVNVATALGPDATPTAMNAAVLHEVLENTEWTIGDLARSGVDPVVYEAVNVLTRQSGETYMDYIRRICGAPGVAGEIARQVKVADLIVSVDGAVSDTLRQRYEQSLPLVQGALATTVA